VQQQVLQVLRQHPEDPPRLQRCIKALLSNSLYEGSFNEGSFKGVKGSAAPATL
jgi:hypothetical protein